MLEKGLSMRPRRETFAAAYIEDVVAQFLRGASPRGLTESDLGWAEDVLDDYFQATRDSPDTDISRARGAFLGRSAPERSGAHKGPARRGNPQSSVRYDDLSRLAQQRQSVRWFQSEPVSRREIDRALEVAIEAPTACNRIPYRFVILDQGSDAADIARLAGGTAGFADNIPALVVAVGDLSAYSEDRDRHLIYIDSSLAIMSLLFALEAQGISSCCINWPDVPHREREMTRALGLAPYERVIMLVALGYADPEGYVPGSAKTDLRSYRSFDRPVTLTRGKDEYT